jgi:hypothetical protein
LGQFDFAARKPRPSAWLGFSACHCSWINSGMLGDSSKPCRDAHDPWPDPQAKRQDSARGSVVQAIGGELGQAHLRQQCGPQLRLEEWRRLGCTIGSNSTTRGMQRDGYAVAGK